MSSVGIAQTQQELTAKSAGGLFARMWRTEACPKAKAPRYPSVVLNGRGELLLMFTCKQGQAEKDVLVVARSGDGGRTWPEPRTVYAPAQGTPRALGTLTRLSSGKLVTAFDERPGTVRFLASQDDGRSWQVSAAIACSPLRQAVPYGRLVAVGTELLMPLFGRLSVGGKEAPCSGLLRSGDGGKTWGAFTVIACDRKEGKVEYGPTAVHADPNGTLLALISVGKRFIYRSLSTDGGKSWSEPDQRLLACNPALAAVGSTLACVDQDPVDRGVMRVQFSHNLFDSWRCDRMLEYFVRGEYASALALDEDRLLLVYDRGGLTKSGGARVTGGIEVAMMQRNPAAPPVPETIIPPEKRDRWELSEQFAMPVGGGEMTQTPDGKLMTCSGGRIYLSSDHGKSFQDLGKAPADGLIGVLRSGRWLLAARKDVHYTNVTEPQRPTSPDGYLYWDRSGGKIRKDVRVFYSDNRGRTWEGGALLDQKPLLWAVPYGRFLELNDGTVVMTVYGDLSNEDDAVRRDCCGLFRSTDGGKSWGDFSRVAYDQESRQIAYNEMDIQPMPDGTWAALIRTEWVFHGPGEPASSAACFSTDLGRTWTKPEFAFIGAVPSLVLLPDGGLAWAGSWYRARLSYDGGHTWSRELMSHTTHYAVVQLLGKDHLLLHDNWRGRSASIYRRIPARANRKEP